MTTMLRQQTGMADGNGVKRSHRALPAEKCGESLVDLGISPFGLRTATSTLQSSNITHPSVCALLFNSLAPCEGFKSQLVSFICLHSPKRLPCRSQNERRRKLSSPTSQSPPVLRQFSEQQQEDSYDGNRRRRHLQTNLQVMGDRSRDSCTRVLLCDWQESGRKGSVFLGRGMRVLRGGIWL